MLGTPTWDFSIMVLGKKPKSAGNGRSLELKLEGVKDYGLL